MEKEKYNSKYGMTIENGMTLQEWLKEFINLYKEGRVKNTTVYTSNVYVLYIVLVWWNIRY